jgi:hypothetical protein
LYLFFLVGRCFSFTRTVGSSKAQNYDTWIDESAFLYNGYVKTTTFQKFALAIGSALMAFYDPLRTDMVAILGPIL